MSAAIRRSSSCPFAHEPMKHWLTGRCSISEIGTALLATPPGRATYGSSVVRSTVADARRSARRGSGVDGRVRAVASARARNSRHSSSAGKVVKSADTSAPWVAIVRRSFIGTVSRPGPPNSRLWLVASP